MSQSSQESVTCEIVGLYPVTMTVQELKRKMIENPDYTTYTFDYVLSLFSSLYLFEVKVSDAGAISSFINEITQETGYDQAAYDESYFDQSGTQQIDEPDKTSNGPCRLCFYLHFVDLKVPLEINGKFLRLPAPSEMPKRLAEVLEYQPLN